MKVESATLEDVFDYPFKVGARKFLSLKGKRYLHELFKKWDPEHLEHDEDFVIIWIMLELRTLLEMKTCRILI